MQSLGVDRRSISGFRGRDVSSAWKHVDIVLLVATTLVLLFGLVMPFQALRNGVVTQRAAPRTGASASRELSRAEEIIGTPRASRVMMVIVSKVITSST